MELDIKNRVYKTLIDIIYSNLPQNIKRFLPEYFLSQVSLGNQNLDAILYGALYVPYFIGTHYLLHKIVGIKKEDINKDEIEEILNYRYLFVGLIIPAIEELLFRVLPYNIGNRWGDTGSLIALLISQAIFSAAHLTYYKRKRGRAFLARFLNYSILTHVYLVGGFLSSFSLHALSNTIAYIRHKIQNKFKRK